jgi:hypothetical protein
MPDKFIPPIVNTDLIDFTLQQPLHETLTRLEGHVKSTKTVDDVLLGACLRLDMTLAPQRIKDGRPAKEDETSVFPLIYVDFPLLPGMTLDLAEKNVRYIKHDRGFTADYSIRVDGVTYFHSVEVPR